MNKNRRDIKNTLFHFTTMRAPNLLDISKKSNEFIIYPYATTENIFLNALKPTKSGNAATNRKQILLEVAKSFEAESLKSRTEVEDIVGTAFYKFAIWLTANRTKLTVDSVNLELPTSFKGLTKPQILTLWNNLLYQVVSYASGPIRENIFSVLIANFFLTKVKDIAQTDKAYKKLAQTRIVISKELFVQKTIFAGGSIKNNAVNTKFLDKELQAIALKEQLDNLQSIKAEVQKLQKKYTKAQQVAYKNALDNHQKEVDLAYEKATKIVQTYIDPETKLESKYTSYENLNIPKFEFVKAPELESLKTLKMAPSKAVNVINNLATAEGYTTFNEVTTHINTAIAATTETLFETTDFENTLVNYNGTLIPTAQNTNIGNTFSIIGNRLATTLLFKTDFDNASIISANYSITFAGETTPINGSSFTDSIINNKLAVKIVTNNEVKFFHKNHFSITGVFVLNNNQKIHFTGEAKISAGASFFIGLDDYNLFGNGSYTLELLSDTGGTPTSDSDNAIDYIPSNFGIKRLGISDYRKVEQSICCYVAGEVSHIENIMAREYKDRETRSLHSRTETDTKSTETEKEKLSDTTTAERFEMNQEVASVLAKDTQLNGHASFNANWGPKGGASYGLETGADFSTATSSEISDSQAVTYAKDVTTRALEKVILKTKEERTVKVIEEFEEKNTHGFDNRKGDSHISGVYRWVDKIYKNQVINYGKRLMYEFMIPEPAAFHNLAITTDKKIKEPIDPRTFDGILNLKDYRKINANTYAHWAGIYNADVEPMPEQYISISKSVSREIQGDNGAGSQAGEGKMEIPDDYEIDGFTGHFTCKASKHGIAGNVTGIVSVAGVNYAYGTNTDVYINSDNISNAKLTKTLEFSVVSWDTGAYFFNLVAKCKLTDQAYKQWQINTFNTIIKAYEEKVAAYNIKVAEVTTKKTNPKFFRQIENMMLRKNCISYLASQENMGADLLKDRTNLAKLRVDYTNENLETYAARVKFFEQAFEWNIMSYNFYPFYWANKDNWKSLYNVNKIDDPLHRSFLQSGMARVIVTVRPGFEEVVNWYMATGQIWNGGQVPTPDNDLFLSIIEELREPEGAVEETWETRVPSSLTVIQAGSIGLNVEGLPCNTDCNDFRLFDSDGVEILDALGNSFTNPIAPSTAQIGQNSNSAQDAGNGSTGGGTNP